MRKEDILRAQRAIGYAFKNAGLLVAALTHSSFANENVGCESNERLEFLGDAILNFVTARVLYGECKNEGEMSKRRSALVSRVPLRMAVERLGLQEFVRYGNGINESKFSDKAISNVYEAILAAIYLDSDLKTAAGFVKRTLVGVEREPDYKSSFQEYLQARGKKPEYKTRDVGTESEHYFESIVYVDGASYGFGEGSNKRKAEQAAAKIALNKWKTKGKNNAR